MIQGQAQISTFVDKNSVPDLLKNIDHWICWRLENGKKVPYGGKKYEIKINALNKKFWVSFERAFRDHQKYGCSGIGFVLDGSGIIGIDLDDCVTEGVINPEALALLDSIGADYIEFSPSGLGLRSFVFGTLDNPLIGISRGVKLEIYAEKRYLTVTGNRFRGSKIASVFNLPAITSTPLACVSSVSSVSSVNKELLATFEIPQSLIPDRHGQRSALLFKLARRFKKHLSDARPRDLKPIVQRWHEMALPYIATKPFEDTWRDFCYGFDRVKYPEGEIMGRVLENLPALLPNMNGVGEFGESGDRLLQIFLGLSALTEDGVFFLSCRTAGELLGISHTEAARLLQAFVGRNVLKIVTPGTRRDAARYRLVKVSEGRA